MRSYLRFIFLFLAWIASGWISFGCFGGPGVEPPFSAESDGQGRPGPLDNDFAPRAGATDGEPIPGKTGATDREPIFGSDDVAPEPSDQDREQWYDHDEGPTTGGDATSGGYTSKGAVGDGGVPVDAGDGGALSHDAGDGGDWGDAERVQREAFFE